MRERSVPCRYATFHETEQDRHVTWNDDGICNPCLKNIERFTAHPADAFDLEGGRPVGEIDTVEKAMVEAYYAATDSPDPRTQNGAILLTTSGVMVAGFNDFPAGVSLEHWDGPREGKYARVVHAETSVLLQAARHGIATEGSTMVCPWAACSNCAKHIAAAGVVQLVRHPFSQNGVMDSSHWFDDCLIGDEILTQAGVKIVEIAPVPCDAVLRRDGSTWVPGEA